MTVFHQVGFFDRLPKDQRRDAVLAYGVRPLIEPERSSVLAYLEQGTAVLLVAGPTIDHLDNSGRRIGPAHILTDGRFAWTKDVAFYVRQYDLALPGAFLARMRELDWKPPSVDDTDIAAVAQGLGFTR